MPSSEINVGDAVTYIAEKGGKDGMIITHEVMKVNIDENGKYSFNTKGVANNIEDPIVYEDQVLGKVIHKFFFLSILGRITTNMVLTLIFVIIPIAFIAAIELFKAIQRDVDEDDEEDDDEEIEEEEETSEKKEPEPEEEKDLDFDDDGEDDFEEEDFDEDESEEEIEEESEEDESDKEIENKNKK